MPFFVYVLVNSSKKIYISQTNNIFVRIERHNSGLVRSTAPYRPWNLLLFEEFETRNEAIIREKALKGEQGREYIKNIADSSIGTI
jgi:putative endonuclease